MNGLNVRSSSLTRETDQPSVGEGHDLASTDIGRFAEAIMRAQRELLDAARPVREEFSLGPRGTWILGLLATNRIRNQAELVKRYNVARSIITEEVNLLVKAGMVVSEPHPFDRRQISLRITAAGERANATMGEAMAARMAERLGRYTTADLLFCTGLLEDLARPRSLASDTEAGAAR